MRRGKVNLRIAALLAAGELAVHQLRYLLWYGHGSDGALSAQGHAYLGVLAPALVIAGVLATARLLGGVVAGGRMSPPRLHRLWPALALALVGMYALQESLEGLLSTGHPPGIEGVFGGGGWLALPLSLAIGLALALAARAAAHAPQLLPKARSLRPRARPAPPRLHACTPLLPRREPCLCGAGARAPPAVAR